MSSREKIDSVYDFTDKGLVELKAWLEPWFRDEAGESCCPAQGDDETYSDAVLADPCLQHYWPADEASGDLIDRADSWNFARVTHDYVGETWPQYGLPGPLTEQPEMTAVANNGLQGVATHHDGGFSYVFVTAPPYWTAGASFTIEVWAYLTAYASSGGAYLLTAGSNVVDAKTIEFYIFPTVGGSGDPGQFYFRHGGISIHDSADFPLNSWQYIVARYNGTTVDLFLNATVVATATGDSAAGIDGKLTWLNHGEGGSPFRGRSAHLAIYDCALSDSTIAAHYALRGARSLLSDGYVLTTDGDGGTVWAYPTVKVAGTRYGEILLGPGLTATDNGDGTVTIDVA